ncbi:hypothetical protein ABZZ47_30100 [Streptomyces sp. NPDC006465]|uniref:hypothetical protein n=1 Tax=Streptomyces sp. NPDC006465 TaxID=3157174 RepID=UPI0033A5AFC3
MLDGLFSGWRSECDIFGPKHFSGPSPQIARVNCPCRVADLAESLPFLGHQEGRKRSRMPLVKLVGRFPNKVTDRQRLSLAHAQVIDEAFFQQEVHDRVPSVPVKKVDQERRQSALLSGYGRNC